jgi:2-haloacid dehalogenase
MIKDIKAVIFDLGGVLIDWNPEYLYRKIFSSDEAVRHFLSSVCTSDWNEEQDAGRTLAEGTDLLVKAFPHYEKEIRAYYGRWEEMIGGVIDGTVEILRTLKQKDHLAIYALTNWSAETIPIAVNRYEFFQWFDGMVVSGTEKMRKPFPEFYRLILDRYGLSPSTTLFIDDNLRNIHGARATGLHAIHFKSPGQLKKELQSRYGL